MAAVPAPAPPVPLATLMRGLTVLLEQLQREHAHGEVVVVLQDGAIRLVRVQRTYPPSVLAATASVPR